MAEGYARASGQGRRRDRHLRPGCDEPRHADRRRVDGLDPDRLHHRPGAHVADRHRWLPGVRHHRDHDADRQALVARDGPARHPRRDQGGVPHREHRPLRARARRHPPRRAGGRVQLHVPGQARAAGLATTDQGASAPDSPGGRGDREGRAPRALRRRRHDQRRCLPRAPRARRGRSAARDHDADGQGRLPRVARAALRLARDARAEVGEHRDEHVRRARRRRCAVRRPRHRQALGVRAGRDRGAPRHRRRRDLEAARGRRARGRAAQEGARTSSRARSPSTARAEHLRPWPGSTGSRRTATSSRFATRGRRATC